MKIFKNFLWFLFHKQYTSFYLFGYILMLVAILKTNDIILPLIVLIIFSTIDAIMQTILKNMSLQTEHDTICWKVGQSIDIVEEAIKTMTFDPITLVKHLDGIRKDAQRMEDALKIRKKIMEAHNLEKEYQEAKGKHYATAPQKKAQEMNQQDKLQYHITVTDKINNDEVIYDEDLHGGAVSMVVEIEEIDEQGDISGQSKQFFFGHELTQFFAVSQMQQKFSTRAVQTMVALRNAVENKTFIDPEKKKHLLKVMNNNV